MKIIFLEFHDELVSFLAWAKQNGIDPASFIIIVLEPKLELTLKSLGLSYRTTLQYFSNDSHREIVLSNKNATDKLAAIFEVTDSIGLSSVYLTDTQFYLSFYFNYVARITELMLNVSAMHKGAEFFVCDNDYKTDATMIGNNDRFLADVFKEGSSHIGCKYSLIPGMFKHTGGSEMTPKSFSSALAKAFIKLRSKKVIVVPGKSYGFEGLIKKIKREIPDSIFVTPLEKNAGRSLKKELADFVLGIMNGHFNIVLDEISDNRNIPAFADELNKVFSKKDVFSYRGIDLGNIIKTKALLSLPKHLSQLENSSLALKKLLDELCVDLVISPHSRGLWYSAGELSRKYAFNSLFVSHGAHPVPVDDIHEAELVELCKGFMLGPYTHIALSTPVQEKHLRYFKKNYNTIKNTEIKTGALIFGLSRASKLNAKKALGIDPSKFVFTYAVTTKTRGTERFYFLETEQEYLASLADIIKVIDQIPDAILILRVHPGYSLDKASMRSLLPTSNNCIIQSEGSFSSVLDATDSLISYSSTSMDEALIDKVPVIIYDRWKRYDHYGTPPFKIGDKNLNAVNYVTDTTLLITIMDKLVNNRAKLVNIDFSAYSYASDVTPKNMYDFIRKTIEGDLK